MTIKSGSHSIGPENGKLTVNTYVGGMVSKMGHDLVLGATKWQGTVTVDAGDPSATSVEVSVDPRSLEILQASGGVKALSDKDRGDIASNSDKTLNTSKYPEITFKSTGVSGAAPNLKLNGNLTISGQTRPVTLDIAVQDTGGDVKFTGRTALTHSDFGVKPYSKMGALKIKDGVDFQIELTLPSA
ncbi:MAG: YceI family protein [Acidimicrobiales bacterium]